LKRIYFDASAYTKVFTEETGSDNAKRLFELAYKNRVKIVLSVWTINESIAAIDKKCHQKKMMSQEICSKIIAATFRQIKEFSERTSRNIVFAQLEKDIINDSNVLIAILHISADDAVHVTTACYYSCDYFTCKDSSLKEKVDNKVNNLRILDITNKQEIDGLIHRL
jgi:predicted nucleic acid-binding protein